MSNSVIIIGYTDSITECECCGKTNLKGTYCLEIDGEEFYYGSVCAFKNHGVTLDELQTHTKINRNKDELKLMLSQCNGSDFSKYKIIKFIKKTGLDLYEFLRQYGVLVEDMKHLEIYSYGSQTFNFDK